MGWYCLGNELILLLVLGMLLISGLRDRRDNVLSLVGVVLVLGGLLMFMRLGLGNSVVNMGCGLLLIGGGIFCLSGDLKDRGLEFSLLVVLYLIGTVMVLSWSDFVGFYIGLEIQSLSGYLLMGWRRDVYSVESSIKYFVVGSVGSGLFLLGVVLVYVGVGSVSLEEIWVLCGFRNTGISVGLFLLLVGLLLKLGSGGFHQWWIDVLEGGDVRSSGLISVVGKVSIILLIVRLMPILGEVKLVLVWSGVLSLVVSVLGCYYQRRIKRFMGYSSLGFLGSVLIMCGLCSLGDDLSSVMDYLLVYGGMSIGLWCVIEGVGVVSLDELRLALGNNGYLVGSVGLLFLSMVGLPPLYGFVVKFKLLLSVVGNGGLVLGLLMVVLGILSGFNYVRWLKVAYYESLVSSGLERRVVRLGLVESLVVGLIVLLVFFGLVL